MNEPIQCLLPLIAAALVFAPADVAFGYVGPAGIGALGVLLVVSAVLLIGIVGLVLHPIRLLRRRRRLRNERHFTANDPNFSANSEVDPQNRRENT